MKVKINQKQRQKIYDYWLETKVKATVARKFKCDPKTVRRIIAEFETDFNVKIESLHVEIKEDDDSKLDLKEKVIPKPKKLEPTKDVQYIITEQSIIVVKDGEPKTINKNNQHFDLIKKFIDKKDWDSVFEYMELGDIIVKYSNGKIKFVNEHLYVDDKILHGTLADRIIQGLTIDMNVDKYINFLNNVADNPDKISIEGLYNFLESNCIEISYDGMILGFKVVHEDYKDIYTNEIDNSSGKVIKMERDKIVSNPNKTCSRGLHICSSKYLKHYGCAKSGTDKIMLCKVNPRDVVSVPNDYNNSKMRVCEYKVVADITENAREIYLKD